MDGGDALPPPREPGLRTAILVQSGPGGTILAATSRPVSATLAWPLPLAVAARTGYGVVRDGRADVRRHLA